MEYSTNLSSNHQESLTSKGSPNDTFCRADRRTNLGYEVPPERCGRNVALDATVEDSWRRIARALAIRRKRLRIIGKASFISALEDFKFLPAGRITAGAGTARSVTLFNCFVMGTVPDSMGGIFDMLKEAALTMQQGGGIGYDFSTIRPKGAAVQRCGGGRVRPVKSFMDVWDSNVPHDYVRRLAPRRDDGDHALRPP